MLKCLALFCVLAGAVLPTAYADTATPSAFDIANNQLEVAYQQLVHHWPKEDLHRKRLISSQRIWRSFRDAECEFVNSNALPADHIDSYKRCVQSMTQARTLALQHYLKCAEAD